MKILIVLIRKSGGVGGSNTEIGKRLIQKGHSVTMLSREDDLQIYSFAKGIFPLRKRIKQIVKQKDIDIIYTQDYSCALTLLTPYPLFWEKHYSCFCGIKTWGTQKKVQTFTGNIMGEKLVVVGNQLKERFPKSTLIHRGVNFEKFKPLKNKRNCLGWVDRDIENISKEKLQEIADSMKLKLLIAKTIPKDEMNIFYNRCKVFISLPTRAGANNVWGEAMAAGVPIVIGNDKGPGPILPFDKVKLPLDLGHGWKLYQTDDSPMEQIENIIKNPIKINYRGWLIENGFNWDGKVEELVGVLK